MEVQLAKKESFVKTWSYAQETTKKGLSKNTATGSLTITNKRIIACTTDDFGVRTEEFYLKDILRVGGLYGKKSSVLGLVICCLLALVCAIVAFVIPFYYLLIATAALVLIGIILFFKSKKVCFMLDIETNGDKSFTLAVGIMNFFHKKRTDVSIDVSLDYESAKEIVNTIGSIIVESRDDL